MHFNSDINKNDVEIVKLDKPLLQKVQEHPGALSDDICNILEEQNYITQRYCRIPKGFLEIVIKLLAYKGRNGVYRVAAKIIKLLLRFDLSSKTQHLQYSHVFKGLQFAHALKKPNVTKDDNPVDYSSNIGYSSEKYDLYIAKRYKAWFDGSQHFAEKEQRLGTWFHHAIKENVKFIKETPSVRRVVNFGACFGIVEYEISKECEAVDIFGIDRSELVKKFNENLFGNKNLHFVAADILDFIDKYEDLSDTHFMVMRTAFIFPENFIQSLFDLLREKRIGSIFILEQYGYCHDVGGLYEFSESYQPSLHYRGGSMVHNYPYFCKEAGLSILNIQYFLPLELTNTHTDANRGISLIASRK
jgi:SAM-dependent methyltransferase